MNKYILFQYDQYYPAGGLEDIHESYDTLDEAIKQAKEEPSDFNEVVDRDTWEMVWSNYSEIYMHYPH